MCKLTNQRRLGIHKAAFLKIGAEKEGENGAVTLDNERTDVFFEH